MRGIIRYALFAMMLLAASVYAQSACDVVNKLDFNQPSSPLDAGNNWKTLCLAGLLISSFIISLMYMLGKTMDNQALLNRAKTDINQVLVTAGMLVVFAAVMNALCALDARAFGLNTPSLFSAARSYFAYSQSVAFSSYMDTTNAIMLLSGLSSLYVNSADAVPLGLYIKLGIALRPFSGFAAAMGALNFVSNLTMLSVAITSGFIMILNVIETWFLNLMLPAGIVMRCFTPTRDFGGVLISIAIGLFVFYPLLFALSYMILGQPAAVGMPDSGGWFETILGQLALFTASSVIPYGLLATLIGQLLMMGDLAGNSVGQAFGNVGASLLPVFILPAINWIVLVGIVRGMSRAMGEEVDISSLARLI
ncbi:Uncharacterised protein [uncultured archaeon]|nr:Uncharacterised protein [uncultured archaeon]